MLSEWKCKWKIIKEHFLYFFIDLFVGSGKAEITIELKNPLNVKV